MSSWRPEYHHGLRNAWPWNYKSSFDPCRDLTSCVFNPAYQWSVQTIDRIVDIFPAEQQDQIRMQLAMSLVGVIAQRLLPRMDKEEKIAAREILINNDAVRNLIISGKSHQLYSVIEIGQKQGMILMDSYLWVLYKKGFISKEILMWSLRDTENIDYLIS